MNSSEPAPFQLLLRPEQAAKILAIGRTQLFALLATDRLESVRIGRLRRIPYAACERYVVALLKQDENT